MSEEDDPDVVEGSLADNTARLTSAVSSLPELLEKKKRIDTHTNIAMALLENIKVHVCVHMSQNEDNLDHQLAFYRVSISNFVLSNGSWTRSLKWRKKC